MGTWVPTSSSAGTAFNGGTITLPQVIDVGSLASAGGLTIQGTSGANVNRLAVDFLHTLFQLTGDGVLYVTSDDYLGVTFAGTGGTAATVEVSDSAAAGVRTVIDSQAGITIARVGAGTASLEIGPSSRSFKAGDGVSGGIYTSPPTPATVALSSGVEAQVLTTRDAHTYTPVTFNPTAGAAATCAVAIGPSTASATLFTVTEPIGVAFDGTIHGIYVYVPAGWQLKFTVANAVLGTTTYY